MLPFYRMQRKTSRYPTGRIDAHLKMNDAEKRKRENILKEERGEGTNMKWDVERIRAEIARLDALTGLNGRNMPPIQIGAARQTLGCFSAKSKDRMFFCFSSHFFEADSFSNAAALDTIAHEYAHYMDYVLNGPNLSHGESWKACCRIVGARPIRLY